MTGLFDILIADDDPDLRDILRSVVEPAGFNVSEASDGKMALEMIRKNPPDLVLLDYSMPEMTGLEVCEHLRQDVLLRHIPVIMLTGRSEIQDKVEGLNAGVDDYLIKPFEPTELLARVRMIMRRTTQRLEANPLTHLPGNNSILHELEKRLAEGQPIAICYVDLDRFKAFNDHYGFKRGDEIIELTARILLDDSKKEGNPGDFVGHIGGDDFITITHPDNVDKLCQAIIRDFDAAVAKYYNESDRKRGYIIHSNRKGHEDKIPLVAISIAVVTNEEKQFTHPGQIAEIGAELKAVAKRNEKSNYVRERRKT